MPFELSSSTNIKLSLYYKRDEGAKMSIRDVNETLQKLLGDGPALALPHDIDGIIKGLLFVRQKYVQLVASRCRRNLPQKSTPEEWHQVAAFLHAMWNLELIDPNMKKSARLDVALEIIFRPEHKFPPDYARIAKIIYDKLEDLRWGAGEEEDEEEVAEVEDLGSTTSSKSRTTKATKTPLTDSSYPADDDPIYGIGGIMSHILRVQGHKIWTYRLHPGWIPRNAKVWGHNGLTNGRCWPNRMALLRDGGHGARMGGIHGNSKVGAFSIVVSGSYAGMDRDLGDTLYYSGSNSHENDSPWPFVSDATKSLEVSLRTGNPIRVFRTHRSEWTYAPQAGLRYDGLYTIADSSTEKNSKGGAYWRFMLTRNGGQESIKIDAPAQELVRLFSRVEEGYTRKR
ncbi:MAG: hypothetical protein M1818_004356 [Claussenomyces sp. TS43310]|nr:MAG: hypothetical protein M1818_004356 [Claussenomyces sp. TS43310]